MKEIKNNNIIIRRITTKDLPDLWRTAYGSDHEWMKWNGPYFNDPVYSFEVFMEEIGPSWVRNSSQMLVEDLTGIIGFVSWHWEDGNLEKWLEFGLCLFPENTWGKGIGTEICRLWIDYLFELMPDLQRVGFTTWSGNKRMMRVGEKLGMTLEARIRNVRYYNGTYYDSIKYGLLKDEWLENS